MPRSEATDAVPPGSITMRLELFKAGDPEAARFLWEEYFARLVGLARVRLRNSRRAAADEEDVALSAFNSFWEGVEKGKFPRLDDRHDLWQVLFVITDRKARGRVKYEMRRKRRRPSGENDPSPEEVAAPEPTPDEVAMVSEECGRLLAKLGDKYRLREVAVWKMEGYTNEEIAERLGQALSTVERKLGNIREIWQDEVGE
jgi:DNA-directed RNA polymerase specialized sigma24 family protein